MEIEKIKHAAVKSEDGKFIFLGKAHADCFNQACSVGIETNSDEQNQGFMTSKGRFVSRKEAATIAYIAHQVEIKSTNLISPMMVADYALNNYETTRGYYAKA